MVKISEFTGQARRGTLAAAVLIALSAPAFGQGEDEETVLDEVIVTGTRIQNTNVVAASPVTTIGAEEINLKQT